MKITDFGPVSSFRCVASLNVVLGWAKNLSQFESLLGGRLPKRAEQRLKVYYDRNVRQARREQRDRNV
jgi:hypothetical protein